MLPSFSSEECDLFADVLALAWEHLRETVQGVDEELSKAALSHSILQAASLGERNKQVLVAYALAHLQPAKIRAPAAVKSGRGQSDPPGNACRPTAD